MSSGSIRIIQLPEKSSVNTDDYMAVDSSANGTKKVKFTDLLDNNLSAQNKAADAQATGEAISELNTDINNTNTRIDNMINTQQNASVTTLWTGSIDKKNQTATLSESIANFDFVDIYIGGTDTVFARKPVSSSVHFEIQIQNMSDDASSQFLRWYETGLTISGTTATINKAIRCHWDDFSQHPVVAQAGSDGGATIIRIDGVKIGHVENDEIIDARVGVDGITYPTLGDAIRTQVTDLKSTLSVVAVEKELPYLTPATVRHPGCVQYTWNTGEYNYYTTSVFNSWYSNIFDVEPNTKYKVLGSMYPMTPIAVFMDADNNYIGHDGFDKDYNEWVFLEKEIIVETPADCTQLIVQRGNNKIPTAREVIIVNSLDDEVEELQKTADKIEPLLVPDGSTPITITLANNSYIDNYGYKMTFNNANYKVTDDIAVTAGDRLIITGTVGYASNSYYSFLDATNTPIEFEISTVAGSKTFDVVVPQNATKLIVNAFGGEAYVGVVENYKIKGASANWESKKWVCVGDSLTEANGTTSKHYFDYIAEETGIETANYGVGGTGYVNPNGTAGNFTTRMASVPTDADVYTIFGSFNDYEYCINNNIPIGSPTDSGTSTICGYINGAFSALFARVPLANLGVIAPNPWGGVNAVSGSSTAKAWAENYTEALRLCCERRSIPFLDLYHYSGMRPWDSAFEALTYTKDSLYGVHPDETGHAILAPKFKAFLESLLM